jgi:hypothetical protein
MGNRGDSNSSLPRNVVNRGCALHDRKLPWPFTRRLLIVDRNLACP